jgi:2-oxoglutarate dehydrogenase E2 component (dihydrolipoamide succinyltransferase)
LCEIETDKITLELNAEAEGLLTIRTNSGETVPVGTVIGTITEVSASVASQHAVSETSGDKPSTSPSARKLAAEKGVNPEDLTGSGRGGRVTVEDILKTGTEQTGTIASSDSGAPPIVKSEEPVEYSADRHNTSEKRVSRIAMTPIRKRIAERLLVARQQTAMLTTFNEADMSRIIELRNRHQEQFQKRHGVKLGYMSFFVKACCEALKEYPAVNSRIDGNDIVTHHYCDIGIAIGGPKGLVVPVIRDAEKLHFAQIEEQIRTFTQKVENNRLLISDLEGGTFTISNGGVYGSLLSTPIINPPQSGVLGMHAIQERPVVLRGEIVIRPMMYLALSYDHRIIDGREAVGFLKSVKEYIEDPDELFLEG